MADIKKSKTADAVGYLYRIALYVAHGNMQAASEFIERVRDVPTLSLAAINDLRIQVKRTDLTEKEKRYWAEKALDEYKRQMFLLRGQDSDLEP